jgi:hypothetical protein
MSEPVLVEWGAWLLEGDRLFRDYKFVRNASIFEIDLLQDFDRIRLEKDDACRRLNEIGKLAIASK